MEKCGNDFVFLKKENVLVFGFWLGQAMLKSWKMLGSEKLLDNRTNKASFKQDLLPSLYYSNVFAHRNILCHFIDKVRS